jgi:predicted dehydrogenase
MQHSRRSFLKSTAAGAIALGAAPAILRGGETTTKAGPRYTLALVGTGWWGTNILGAALADGHVKLVALCDVDQAQLKQCGESIRGVTADSPKMYGDYREMLEKEKLQIVIVATPDHWHPLIMIAAVKAGAHVYVEKPISHTVLEGSAMVKTARETGKVVQVGTHRRVAPHNISAREFLRSGKAGKIGAIRCFVYSGGGEEKPRSNEEPPKTLDWDFYCGPAPLRPFNKKIHTRGFRQFLDFANGQLGDWGIHWIDQALWITERDHPKTIFSAGGRSIKGKPINDGKEQTSDAPDHQVVTYDLGDDLTLTWEHRQFAGNGAAKGEPVGAMFYCTGGTFHLGWQSGWTFYAADGEKILAHEDSVFSGETNSDNIPELWRDFIESIQQNRRPVCDIEIGHRATAAALLGMLSLKLGRSVQWDGQTIPNDHETAALLKRNYRAPWQYPV